MKKRKQVFVLMGGTMVFAIGEKIKQQRSTVLKLHAEE